MKRFVSLVLAIVLCFGSPLAEGKANEIQSTYKVTEEFYVESECSTLSTGKVENDINRMKYLVTIGAEIHITDTGVATVYADAISDADDLSNLLVVAELQQLVNGSWVTLRTYRYFTADTSAVISQTCNVSRGYYYRVRNTTTAYVGNDSETRVAETPSWNFYVPGTY